MGGTAGRVDALFGAVKSQKTTDSLHYHFFMLVQRLHQLTDLEMNSTYRGAVEVLNLCCHLDERDVLNAECIRTFQERTIDGRSWFNRLEESQNSQEIKTNT